jgi:II/X family phage/plasmid replication protein
MIDWLTLRIHAAIPIPSGKLISVDADGEVEYIVDKRHHVEGSYSSKTSVRFFGYDLTTEISGNPAKFLQGHNLFGSSDLYGLSQDFIASVADRLGYRFTANEQRLIEEGMIILTRIDTTEMWGFGNQARALNVIRALGERSHLAYRGRGSLHKESTVYWNPKSTRLAAKAYAKGVELKAHKLPHDIPHRDDLIAYADDKVRIEFTVRSPWLKRRGLDVCRNWPTLGVTPEGLHAELMSKLSVTDAVLIESDHQDKLEPVLRLVYDAWQAGKDLRRILPRSTFYKRRKQLLKHGIDIAATVPTEPVSNVVPLRVTFEGKPATVPTWAVGTPLYHQPQRRAA